MAIRLHELYPIPEGAAVQLRDNEIAAVRAEFEAAANEDIAVQICIVCSEVTLAARNAGTGLTTATITRTPGPQCQALLAQIGAPPTPTQEFILQTVLGNRYIATSVR